MDIGGLKRRIADLDDDMIPVIHGGGGIYFEIAEVVRHGDHSGIIAFEFDGESNKYELGRNGFYPKQEY